MRVIWGSAIGVLLLGVVLGSQARRSDLVRLDRHVLDQPLLLQTSYELQRRDGRRDFMTSRSRVVRFRPEPDVMVMYEHLVPGALPGPADVLARIPMRREARDLIALDLNAGFDRVSNEEDRTGRDYYDPDDRQGPGWSILSNRRALGVWRHGDTVVFDQSAETDDGAAITVHYYLSPYHPDSGFRPFEMRSLEHFGFYETYPTWQSGRQVSHAMKFSDRHPVTFAVSSTIPERHREAVQDGILYWNRALGQPLIRVVNAPHGLRLPSPQFNVVEWAPRAEASATHIQGDPRTGEILHAHVFVRRETTMDDALEQQNDQLRFFVAHEIGHALGLRHNFGPGPTVTVMDYLRQPEELEAGRRIGTRQPALPYDRDVIRHVYLGAPLDVSGMPPFCTDGHPGCLPFAARQRK